jgi:hypothetical protein
MRGEGTDRRRRGSTRLRALASATLCALALVAASSAVVAASSSATTAAARHKPRPTPTATPTPRPTPTPTPLPTRRPTPLPTPASGTPPPTPAPAPQPTGSLAQPADLGVAPPIAGGPVPDGSTQAVAIGASQEAANGLAVVAPPQNANSTVLVAVLVLMAIPGLLIMTLLATVLTRR